MNDIPPYPLFTENVIFHWMFNHLFNHNHYSTQSMLFNYCSVNVQTMLNQCNNYSASPQPCSIHFIFNQCAITAESLVTVRSINQCSDIWSEARRTNVKVKSIKNTPTDIVDCENWISMLQKITAVLGYAIIRSDRPLMKPRPVVRRAPRATLVTFLGCCCGSRLFRNLCPVPTRCVFPTLRC